jgi:hypothetical protein
VCYQRGAMVGQRLVAVLAAYAVLMSPLLANAQCKADVDCKGDRVCEGGQCVDPKTKLPEEEPPRKVDDDGVKVTISDRGYEDTDNPTNWALPAGIIGIIGMAAVLGLGIASEITKEDNIPSIPLGAGATVLVAAIGPVEFAGGASARRASGAGGVAGLRIAGWVAYGVSLALALYLIAFGLLDNTPFDGLITTTSGIGALSLLFFAIDDFVSYSEASDGAISMGAPFFSPVIGMARESGGGAIPTLGLGAAF